MAAALAPDARQAVIEWGAMVLEKLSSNGEPGAGMGTRGAVQRHADGGGVHRQENRGAVQRHSDGGAVGAAGAERAGKRKASMHGTQRQRSRKRACKARNGAETESEQPSESEDNSLHSASRRWQRKGIGSAV